MLLTGIATLAIVFFIICLVAVLQAWSKGTTTEHLFNLFFISVFGFGALWGVRTLFGLSR